MKLVDIGGAGYVGSVIVYQLIEADHEKAVISDAWNWMQARPDGYE